ncbi:hypothetical protein FNH22_03415 [Fulvivirga sp. M361]|uniref:hypothetical protein n=1 Tax=Fulvivirga sp. M361 TaxID=2594266 RepID=UPI00117BAD54|nr:hypothetical protein [Fulvivirga sp. M361]TRX61837.1 hypothetical protein FNH22_03415 [Fulvivirga sp. M361]
MIITFLSSATSGRSQSTDTAAESDTWYVWMDAKVNKGAKRVVSNMFVIDCCVKSPKYRKLLRQAEKWIRKNVDESYSGEDPLKKIQDEKLALAMVTRAKSEENAEVVDFQATCSK